MSFAGVSIVDGDDGSGRSAASAAAAGSAHGRVPPARIYGYSGIKRWVPNGECVRSCSFTVGGHRWCTAYYPSGDRSRTSDSISVWLFLDEDSVAEPVKVQFALSFGEEPASIRTTKTCTFLGPHYSWGYRRFVRKQTLERSTHLRDDCLTVRCDIIVAPPLAVAVRTSDDIGRHLNDLLISKDGADVTFEVGAETFAAHRCVLAARSPVFKALLFGHMKEGAIGAVVRIDDMEAQVFRWLLTFIYTDSLPDRIEEHAAADDDCNSDEEDYNYAYDDCYAMYQHLLVAADRYDLTRLKLICEEELCEDVNLRSVATNLSLAEQHHCHRLKEACLEFIKSSTRLRSVLTAAVSTVTDVIALAEQLHCCSRSKESCFEFLETRRNLHEVFTADGSELVARTCPSVLRELSSYPSCLLKNISQI